jgi:Uma2 family endonuclease
MRPWPWPWLSLLRSIGSWKGNAAASIALICVRVLATGVAGYPDVTVVCNKLELDPDDANTATNPAVAVAILSPSTEQYDRGEKLRQYQAMPSLLHVVLVAHDERRIDVWSRRGNDWSMSSARQGEQATLPGISCTLLVDDIYRDPLRA